MFEFSPTNPCRCGFDGTGRHRCHAGRPDPATGENGSRHCEADADPKLIATRAALSGMQMKTGVIECYYCPEHREQWKREAGLA